MVSGSPAAACAVNVSTTDPRLPSTLPKRTLTNRRPAVAATDATISSPIRLEEPRTQTGSAALSVETLTNTSTPAAAAAISVVTVPHTLVLTASPGKRSRRGWGLSAVGGRGGAGGAARGRSTRQHR